MKIPTDGLADAAVLAYNAVLTAIWDEDGLDAGDGEAVLDDLRVALAYQGFAPCVACRRMTGASGLRVAIIRVHGESPTVANACVGCCKAGYLSGDDPITVEEVRPLERSK